jgi:mRNA-degrading endonuclease toxin of MazEF toxin-antitoxin module
LSKRTYIPQRGDIIHLNLGSTGGNRDIDGPHYALVISTGKLQQALGLCVVVPTTCKHHPELGDLAIRLPTLAALQKEGWALLHHVRSVDFRERSATFAARLDVNDAHHQRFLTEMVDRLFGLLD